MIFDSEEQRQQFVQLILQVPVQTDLASAIKDGPIPIPAEVAGVLQAIEDGTIAGAEEPGAS